MKRTTKSLLHTIIIFFSIIIIIKQVSVLEFYTMKKEKATNINSNEYEWLNNWTFYMMLISHEKTYCKLCKLNPKQQLLYIILTTTQMTVKKLVYSQIQWNWKWRQNSKEKKTNNNRNNNKTTSRCTTNGRERLMTHKNVYV